MDKEDVIHIYNEILLSHKKKEMSFVATGMHPEIIRLSEVSQRDKHHRISLTCDNWKKKIQWTYLQNRNRLTENIEKLKVTKGEKGEGLNEEFGTNRHITIYKTDKQGPMYSTGNCI